MTRSMTIIFCLILTAGISGAVPNPTLEDVFQELGLELTLEDKIHIEGNTQGVFVKVDEEVRVYPIAKYSDGSDPEASRVRIGFYYHSATEQMRQLFECGALADGHANITGLPTRHNLPFSGFDPKVRAFGFYAQSAQWNPQFSADGETVYSQARLNQRIERFEEDGDRLRIFPYRIKGETKDNWYVLCWDFTGERLFQDLVMVVRGATLVTPLPNPDDETLDEEKQRTPYDNEPYAITMRLNATNLKSTH